MYLKISHLRSCKVKFYLVRNPFIGFILMCFVWTSFIIPKHFLDDQKKYPRVRTALSAKLASIQKIWKEKNISSHQLEILLIAFKAEGFLELYAKNKTDMSFSFIKRFSICASSGNLGPKKRKGDAQVPEGFYHVDRFNPNSQFYLSLGINYPNEADRIKANGLDPGGDIFIHGSCVTIGCLPITDDQIKELYVWAMYAHHFGQNKIPVYIFPFRMTDDNWKKYSIQQADDLASFWKNLKQGYDHFFTTFKPLKISVTSNGRYHF